MPSSSLGREFAFLQILTGAKKGKAVKLLSSRIVIGGSSKCDLIFKEDPLCSPEHALISKEGSDYFVQSLNSQNPVLLNKKPINKEILNRKDEIQIGKTSFRFTLKQESPSGSFKSPPPPGKTKKRLPLPRLILILFVLGGLALFFLDQNPAKKQSFKLKTEQDLFEATAALEKQNKEEIEKLELNFKQKTAQAAFISGFRDYRKGYYKRALSFFKHCSMIDKANPLCRRYELKSQSQIEKLIEKKIRTGNAYMEKKQYSACEAVFRSVQIMMEDSSSPVYKEAEMKRKSCSLKLKNRI